MGLLFTDDFACPVFQGNIAIATSSKSSTYLAMPSRSKVSASVNMVLTSAYVPLSRRTFTVGWPPRAVIHSPHCVGVHTDTVTEKSDINRPVLLRSSSPVSAFSFARNHAARRKQAIVEKLVRADAVMIERVFMEGHNRTIGRMQHAVHDRPIDFVMKFYIRQICSALFKLRTGDT